MMKYYKNISITLQAIILVFIVACKPTSKTTTSSQSVNQTFLLTTSGITNFSSGSGNNFVRGLSKNISRILPLDTSNSVPLARGKWSFQIVSFDGADFSLGKKYCGALSNVDVTLPPKPISLSINESACSAEPYLSLIKEITAKFQSNKAPSVLEGNAVLVSSALTRKTVATMALSCPAGITHYFESSSKPTLLTSGWIACPAANFNIEKNLSSGVNNFNFWFKGSNNFLSANSKNISVKQGESFLITSPNNATTKPFGDITPLPQGFLVKKLINGNLASEGGLYVYNNAGNLVRTLDAESPSSSFGHNPSLMNLTFALNVGNSASKNGTVTGGGIIYFYDMNGILRFKIEGDNTDDGISSKVIPLKNGNWVVSFPSDDVNGIQNVGSVKLVNGITGAIIATIVGENSNDRIGAFPNYELSNGNFVIRSAITSKIVNGQTGAVITNLPGNTIPFVLSNGNYVVSSPNENVGDLVKAGVTRLIHGTTGITIAAISGDNTNDSQGYMNIQVLKNNNFTISTPMDDVNGIVDAGSVKLVNGSTGAVIATYTGDNSEDQIGYQYNNHNEEFENNYFLITSPLDDVNNIVDMGTVKLVNGSSGALIKTILIGKSHYVDQNGTLTRGLEILQVNNNFVIANSYDTVSEVAFAGSIKLFNGATGNLISSFSGNNTDDYLGIWGLTKLSNNNFIVKSPFDDVNGISNAGSVMLINGSTGNLIATISGDNIDDKYGYTSRTPILENGNFIIDASEDDVNSAVDAGSVKLVNGLTGAVIVTISGDNTNDRFGREYSTKILKNNNLVIENRYDDANGLTDNGSVFIVNGSTGAIISHLVGDNDGDTFGGDFVVELSSGDILISTSLDDVNGITDAGSLTIVPMN